MKLTKRKGFNFFRSYFDVYNELETDKDKVAFIDALFDRQFLGVKPDDLKGMAKFAYISQTNSIDTQVKGYEDRMKGLNKSVVNYDPWQGVEKTIFTPPQQVQEKEKGEETEKVQEKVQLIINREAEFKNSLQPFLEEFGSNTLNDFYLYWTEKKPKGKKMLFEMQKTFDVKRRLDRWNKNNFANKEKSSAKKEDAALILHRKYGIID
jgi:hypothetical protein